jgi:hypothetical protein
MSAFLIAGLCLIASALIVRLLDRWCRPVPLIELMRWQGNDDARARYDARMKAAGHAPVRNVRDVTEESA